MLCFSVDCLISKFGAFIALLYLGEFTHFPFSLEAYLFIRDLPPPLQQLTIHAKESTQKLKSQEITRASRALSGWAVFHGFDVQIFPQRTEIIPVFSGLRSHLHRPGSLKCQQKYCAHLK